jgi:hypothetical protein
MSLRSLRMIHIACIHSIIAYGIIFWGNSPKAIKLFRTPKQSWRNYDGSEEKRFT